MDDILILAPTRWKLKKAIRVLNQTFKELNLEKHPGKTYIGRIEKSFDFLGYHFGQGALGLANKTVENFVSRLHRLYEQKKTALGGAAVLGDYVTRWLRWTHAGLAELGCSGLPRLAFASQYQTGEAPATPETAI